MNHGAAARDRAFGFYYPGDLDRLEHLGAELINIDTLNDTHLPEIDGLFIGGGFPERYGAELQQNSSLRWQIRQAIDAGLPAYAECAGLMYLSQSLRWQGQSFEMVGVIPARTIMHERPQGRGYVELVENNQHPWPHPPASGTVMHAHEFHYSMLEGLPADWHHAYQITRGHGISGSEDGLVYKNLLASYTHLRHTRKTPWIDRFLSFVGNCKTSPLTTRPANGASA